MEQRVPNSDLNIELVGGVAVARFAPELILSGAQAEAVGAELDARLAEPGGQRMLLDFANVRSLSSLMLAKLVALNRAAASAGGRLALCNLRPEIHEILEVTRLTQILFIYRAEPEALQSF